MAGILVMAPNASAEQTVIGPTPLDAYTLDATPPQCGAPGSCTAFQDPSMGGADFVSPVNGVVTSWSVRTGGAQNGSEYSLRIIRLGSGDPAAFTPLRSTPFAPGVTTAATYTQATSLPISVGDRIAVGGTGLATLPSFAPSPNDRSRLTAPGSDPPDGTAGSAPISGMNLLAVNATVDFCRVPNEVGKKIGQAVTEMAAAGCTPKPHRKKKRVKKKRNRNKVLNQFPAAGLTTPPGTEVTLNFRP